jgi:hypothetical protein
MVDDNLWRNHKPIAEHALIKAVEEGLTLLDRSTKEALRDMGYWSSDEFYPRK